MPKALEPEVASPTAGEYELLPPSGPTEQQQSLMGQEEQVLKNEGRHGDLLAMCATLVSVSVRVPRSLSSPSDPSLKSHRF
ncbi:hypothetical protein H0H93_010327 [Arthromyces matolae]|nr:hypothetical protein H0H93_010327 [Arthromyces matolae]